MATEWLADDAFSAFKEKRDELIVEDGINEATTRLRSIDTMLFDVLKWDKGMVVAEKYDRADGYADYVFGVPKFSLVLEAKREGAEFVLPAHSYPETPVPFALIAKECPAAAKALRQAQGYANQFGARYSAITNGRQWIFGLTFVENQLDEDRMVFVFESIEAIATPKKFRAFHECFSCKAISTNLPSSRLLESRRTPPPQKLSAGITNYPVSADRSRAVNTLRGVLQLVWDEANFDPGNPVFLEHCYINPEPAEDMLRVARELLEQRSATDRAIAGEYADPEQMLKTIQSAKEKEQPVVLLGRIGYGKSTFLKYLRHISAREVLRDQYVQIDVDFTTQPATAAEAPAFVLDQVERQLKEIYGIEVYSDAVSRQALKTPLKEFRSSSRGQLLSRPGREKELEDAEVTLIEEFTKDRNRYFRYLTQLIRRGYHKSIAIFFDNLDRRKQDIQEEAFLRASAIAADWAALVFVCLRPSTVQKSQTRGVLDTIAQRVILISPPKTAPMIRKRFQYCAKFARKALPKEAYPHEDFSHEQQNQLPHAADVFEAFDQSVFRKPYLAMQYQAAANGNVRNIIKYVRETLTSSHLNTRRVVEELARDGQSDLKENETLRALICGPYIHYDSNSSLITNLFDITSADPSAHFCRLLLLDHSQRHAHVPETYGFVPLAKIHAYMASLGYTLTDVGETIELLFTRKCLEGRDSNEESPQMGDEVRVTDLGKYHIDTLIRKFDYLDAVVVDTPILDNEVRAKMRDARPVGQRIERARAFLRYLDKAAESLSDTEARHVWSDVSQALANDITDFENAMRSSQASQED